MGIFTNMRNKYLAKVVVCIFLALIAGGFCLLYQPSEQTDKIYTDALLDFNKGEYQNAYYLFSKVSFISPLKPIAIYHQGECARLLNDKDSAIKQFSFLYNNYLQSPLNLRAKYLTAEQLIEKNPIKAEKIFKSIIKKNPDTDYAIAAEYYLAQLIIAKYKDSDGNITSTMPTLEKQTAENYLKYYLKTAPSGKHALNAVNALVALGSDTSAEDYLMMANTAYIFADYKKAEEFLQKTDINYSWPLWVKNSKAQKDIAKINFYTETGLENYANYVEEKDIIDAIDIYLSSQNENTNSLQKLISLEPSKGSDYLMSEQCRTLSGNFKEACYNTLYLKYPEGNFAAEALSNIFFSKLKSKDYIAAKKIGNDHLKKFPDSQSAPMISFWLGKISEATENYDQYSQYYKAVISNYPDSYYAYRAYLRLNHENYPLIVKNITPKPVVFPYQHVNKDLIEKLVELNDYEVVNELCKNDEFIKSWVLHKKGDYTHSVILARNAMAKLTNKPDKYDLRWRLVYPIHYYELLSKYTDYSGNNLPLMLALLKEESHFDPLAQSAVGASGLMQLMPATANEIAQKHEIFNYDLFSPEDNIKLGNLYYADIRTMLSGYDVSAVAAYNGGIGSVNRWKSSLYYNDTDEFVEQIPYCETKHYVKKVFSSYWNYIRIYTGK